MGNSSPPASCPTSPSPTSPSEPSGISVRMAFQITSFVRKKIVVHPPTIFCHILHVLPSHTAPGCCWAVTVADRQGVTVTVDLEAEALQTYERFQAALLRKTGSSFRYLPIEPRAVPTQAPPAPEPSVVAATGKNPRLCGNSASGLTPTMEMSPAEMPLKSTEVSHKPAADQRRRVA